MKTEDGRIIIGRDQCISEIKGYVKPKWIDVDLTGDEIERIRCCGCMSAPYLPAINYEQARKTMEKYSDDIIDYIRENDEECGEFIKIPSDILWDEIPSYLLSYAVETWTHRFKVEDDE